MSASLDLIVFDCDGVLVDSEPLAAQAYGELLAEAGAQATPELWASCIGLKQAEIFARIEASTGVVIGEDARATLWPRTKRLFEMGLAPTPGLIPFLEASPLRRCVASSSSPERIRVSLALTGLARFFDAVFSSQYVARGKPAPDIFLYAAEKMGAEPARMAVIEDSPPGVAGARAAGAHVIGYLGGAHIGPGHGERLTAAGAHCVAENWSQIRDHLAQIG